MSDKKRKTINDAINEKAGLYIALYDSLVSRGAENASGMAKLDLELVVRINQEALVKLERHIAGVK